MRETQIKSLGLEDTLEKEMATHSSILRSLALQADSLLSEPPGKSYLILVVYKSVRDQ